MKATKRTVFNPVFNERRHLNNTRKKKWIVFKPHENKQA